MGRNAKALDVSKYLSETVSDVTRETAVNITQALVLKTAVDTGALRGGWKASIGSAEFSQGSPDKSGGETISRAISVIDRAKRIAYPTIFITNAYPYSYRVMELGSSQQTPPMHLSATIKRFTDG